MTVDISFTSFQDIANKIIFFLNKSIQNLFPIRYTPPVQEKLHVIYKFCEQHYVLAQNLNNYPNTPEDFPNKRNVVPDYKQSLGKRIPKYHPTQGRI